MGLVGPTRVQLLAGNACIDDDRCYWDGLIEASIPVEAPPRKFDLSL